MLLIELLLIYTGFILVFLVRACLRKNLLKLKELLRETEKEGREVRKEKSRLGANDRTG